MNKPDDKELMERCVKGDRQAFETLLVRYEKPVYNAAYRMLHNADDARDVTQILVGRMDLAHATHSVRG